MTYLEFLNTEQAKGLLKSEAFPIYKRDFILKKTLKKYKAERNVRFGRDLYQDTLSTLMLINSMTFNPHSTKFELWQEKVVECGKKAREIGNKVALNICAHAFNHNELSNENAKFIASLLTK